MEGWWMWTFEGLFLPFSLTAQTCRSENSPNSLHTSPCTHPAQGRPQGPPVLPDDLPPRPAGGLPGDGRCHSTASIPFPSFTASSASATSDTILRSRSVILDPAWTHASVAFWLVQASRSRDSLKHYFRQFYPIRKRLHGLFYWLFWYWNSELPSFHFFLALKEVGMFGMICMWSKKAVLAVFNSGFFLAIFA